MIRTSSRPRAAVSAASGTVMAALALVVAPAAYAEDGSWGAIAVSPDGKSVGVATNQLNEYLANLTATSDCQQNDPVCNVLVTFKSPDCGAVATNGEHYFGDIGATQQEAEQNAINQGPGSTSLRAACNNPVEEDTSTAPTSTSTTATPG